MATISKVVQLATFFAGEDQAKETSKNQVMCVAAGRDGDLYVLGVGRHVKVNLLHDAYISSSQIYSYKDTMLQSPSCVNFPLIRILRER